MYKGYLYSGAAIATLIATSVLPAYAQQQPVNGTTTIELETINVEGEAGKKAGAQRGDATPTVATQAETVLTERADRQVLERKQVGDPTEINKLAPGVSYSESNRSFNVRGLDRMRVNTTIDGIPLPYLDDGARGAGSPGATGGQSSVDFDSLSAIDIVKGSDSSVFGSGMLAGGVRFRTLEPEDIIEEGESFGGLSKVAIDSRDESWRAEQALAARIENTSILVQGGYRDGEEMENQGRSTGFAPQNTGPTREWKNPAEYDQENLLVKLRQHLDGGHVIGFTGERFYRDEDIESLTSNTNASPIGPTPRFQPGTPHTEEIEKRERVSLDYRYDGGGWLDQAEATLFWQKQDLSDDFTAVRTGTPTGAWRRNNMREYEIYGLNASALKSIETGPALHNVSFGTQVYGSESYQYSLGVDSCPAPYTPPAAPPGPPYAGMYFGCNFLHTNQSDMPDTNGLTAAAFLQDEIELFDNTVRVTPGIRFDYYRHTPELTDAYAKSPAYSNNGLPEENSDSAFSPKLRFEVDAAQDVTLFAQWARAFRAPTVNELYLTYGGPGTYLRIGEDELEAETSNGFDVGLLVGDDKKGGSIKAFYNRYKNYIDDRQIGTCNSMGVCTYSPEEIAYLASLGYASTDYPSGVTESFNRENVHIYGAEIDAHLKLESGWHGWTQFGAYIGEDMDLNVSLNSIPAAKLVLGVGYERETWGADFIFTGIAERGLEDVENANSTTPSVALLDFTAWWSPAAVEGLTLRAGVFNITDEFYYEEALDLTSGVQNKEYYTQPGRNFRVSATYKF